MSKQDRQGVRSPAELEQKYAFGKTLDELKVASSKQSEQLSQQKQLITEYMSSSGSKLKELEAGITRTEKNITSLKTSVSSLSERMSEADENDRDLNQKVSALIESASSTEQWIAKADKDIKDLKTHQESANGEMLATVVTESLNCETISSDKTFSQIEEAILSDLNVRVKLLCTSENSVIFLQLASFQSGVEVRFVGNHNGLPVVLQILPEE